MADYPYIPVKQGDDEFILTAIPAEHLVKIAYAAVRRQDEEEGAVQRILNNSRISGIRDFALKGGDFPASIVLNWVKGPLRKQNGKVSVGEGDRSAQIIDGQHRVAGLQAAIEEDNKVGRIVVPVAIYENLDTPKSARIFISINTEQRPAPKSLVFDLYGVAGTDLVDPGALRAGDIVSFISGPDQPYEGWIKLPNAKRQRGGVALSTAVSAIKPLVEEKAILDQIGAIELELQKQIFSNYFSALADKYGKYWSDRNNAFLYASGFIGAVEFFRTKMIDYCRVTDSFEKETMSEALELSSSNLIFQSEVKGRGGSDAVTYIRERLQEAFVGKTGKQRFKV
ncbi:DGQHR domain-containing protein [Maritimibacter alexandrii]|uniref:DGQHR domain-containing protein n=1 Tax=Maritimibacter alexandrii TaxID=2570355 RepID=UPI001109BB19|nr:DGQHR domain-containing protein [Maritimibacter alexandrii]